MAKRIILVCVLCLGIFSGAKVWMAAQQDKPDTVFRVTVNMVQLDVAVTDKKGNYITGLSPWDFDDLRRRNCPKGRIPSARKMKLRGGWKIIPAGAPPPLARILLRKPAGKRVTAHSSPSCARNPPTGLRPWWREPVSSSFSIPATTCTGDLCTPRMPLRNSSGRSTIRTGWPSIPTAATFPAFVCSHPTAPWRLAGCGKPWPGMMPPSMTRC